METSTYSLRVPNISDACLEAVRKPTGNITVLIPHEHAWERTQKHFYVHVPHKRNSHGYPRNMLAFLLPLQKLKLCCNKPCRGALDREGDRAAQQHTCSNQAVDVHWLTLLACTRRW
jgi:hypothetical protein